MQNPLHISPSDPALIRDPRTGVYSRRLLDCRLQEETARAHRETCPLVLCLFDIDHFQHLTHLYGVERSRQVLRELGQLVQRKLRLSDALFHCDDHSFVALLPSTNKQQALLVCSRLLDDIAGHAFVGDPQLFVSVSMGVAAYPADAGDVTDLLHMARRRNRAARAQGRGRYVTEDLRDVPMVHFDVLDLRERDEQLLAFQGFVQGLQVHQRGRFEVQGGKGSGRSFFLKHLSESCKRGRQAVLHLQGQQGRSAEGLFRNARWNLPLPVHQGVSGVLRALQEGTRDMDGLLVLIDDAHLLDSRSMEWLHHILQGLAGLPVGLVHTEAAGWEPGDHWHHQVKMVALSENAVYTWVQDLLNWTPPEMLVAWLFEQSRGNPGQVRRLLTHLMESEQLQPQGAGWKLRAGFDVRSSLQPGS